MGRYEPMQPYPKDYNTLVTENDQLRAVNARLREALGRICVAVRIREWSAISDTARDALEGKGT